jgi:hypothetical protein
MRKFPLPPKTQPQVFYIYLIATAICFFLVAQFWIFSFVPFQDHYEWLLQSKLIFDIWSNDTFANAYYYNFNGVIPPPNSLLTIMLAMLHFVFPTKIVGQIFLSLYVLTFVYGFYRYCSIRNPSNPFRYMGLLVVLNYFFYKGFSSYILGLAVFFMALPMFFEQNFFPYKKACQVFVASLLFYFIHGFVFGLFLISFFVWIIKINYQRRQLRNTFIYFLALLPSLVMIYMYAVNLPSPSSSPIEFYPSVFSLLNDLRYGVLSIHRIVLTESTISLSLLNALYLGFLAVIYFSQRKRFQRYSYSAILLYVLTALILLNPVSRIGHFLSPNPRFIPACILLLSGSFVFLKPNQKLETLILIAGTVLTISHFVHLNTFNKQARTLTHEMKNDYNAAASPLVIGKAAIEDFNSSPLHKLSGIVQPYMRTAFYFNLDTLKTFLCISPIAVVQMIHNKHTDVQITFDGRIEAARWRDDLYNALDISREKLFLTYDKIFIVGSEETRKRLSKALMPHFYKRKNFAKWSLYEKNPLVGMQ